MSFSQLAQRIGNRQDTDTSKLFFSDSNVEKLQRLMKRNVQKQTGKTIGPQSPEHLVTIMHHVLKEHSVNSNSRASSNVDYLNKKVLEITVPMIVEGISQHEAYIRDASQMHVPMERSVNTSIKGENSLTMKPFF